MRDPAAYLTYITNAFPVAEANNSTGAATTDGTEFIAELINDLFMGPMQASLDYAGLTPNGITEAAGASQFLEAMQKGFAIGPGVGGDWWLNDDPSVTGHRALLQQGQGVLRANYPDLDAACYVGDGNNAAVAAGGGSGLSRGGFYHADDAAGTIPNISGAYLILPDTRGRSGRGKDTGATVDPQGALRFLGDEQADAGQRITGNYSSQISRLDVVTQDDGVFTATDEGSPGITFSGSGDQVLLNFDSANSISPNTAKTDDVETRGANYLEVKYITF